MTERPPRIANRPNISTGPSIIEQLEADPESKAMLDAARAELVEEAKFMELKTSPLFSPYTTFVVNLLDVPHQHYHGNALYVSYDDVAKLLYQVMPNYSQARK